MTASKHNNPLIQQIGNFQLDESQSFDSFNQFKKYKISQVKKYCYEKYMVYNLISSNFNHIYILFQENPFQNFKIIVHIGIKSLISIVHVQ